MIFVSILSCLLYCLSYVYVYTNGFFALYCVSCLCFYACCVGKTMYKHTYSCMFSCTHNHGICVTGLDDKSSEALSRRKAESCSVRFQQAKRQSMCCSVCSVLGYVQGLYVYRYRGRANNLAWAACLLAQLRQVPTDIDPFLLHLYLGCMFVMSAAIPLNTLHPCRPHENHALRRAYLRVPVETWACCRSAKLQCG